MTHNQLKQKFIDKMTRVRRKGYARFIWLDLKNCTAIIQNSMHKADNEEIIEQAVKMGRLAFEIASEANRRLKEKEKANED